MHSYIHVNKLMMAIHKCQCEYGFCSLRMALGLSLEMDYFEEIKRLQQSCRVCLTLCNYQEHYASLETTPPSRFASYSLLLQQLTSSQIDYNDQGPQIICTWCVQQLDQCLYLIDKCLESQQKITKLLQHQPLKEELIENNPRDQDDDIFDHFDNNDLVESETKKPKKKRGRKPRSSKTPPENTDESPTKNNKEHTCDLCGKQFKHKDNLKMHALTHTGERPYKCYICEKSFIKKDNLSIHIKRHLKEKNYGCELCGSMYYTSSELKSHMKVHTGEKPHVCNICGKSFTSKNNLCIHQRSHTGEKPHSCTVCGKQFTSKNILLIHSRIHTGEKPYVCSVCGKRFSTNKLAVHMRTHTGEKPHACKLCGKKFAATNVLLVHTRRHTGEKPYECKICGQFYGHTQSLNKHMKRQHKVITNPLQIQIHEMTQIEESISLPLDLKDHNLTERGTVLKTVGPSEVYST